MFIKLSGSRRNDVESVGKKERESKGGDEEGGVRGDFKERGSWRERKGREGQGRKGCFKK